MPDYVSIKEHLESRIQAVEKAAIQTASTLEKRLEGMNEFRAQLSHQAGTFLTREAYQIAHEQLQKQVDELRMSRAMLEGKASQNAVMFSIALAVAGLLLGVIMLILKVKGL
jgi:hypothetical protein